MIIIVNHSIKPTLTTHPALT